MSAQDERTWPKLTHLSMFSNLFTGFLGPVAALVRSLVHKDRSQRVEFRALQSMWYQIWWLVILAVGWTVSGLLTFVVVGFALWPVLIVAYVLPFVHSAYRLSQGEYYRYPLAADIAEGR